MIELKLVTTHRHGMSRAGIGVSLLRSTYAADRMSLSKTAVVDSEDRLPSTSGVF